MGSASFTKRQKEHARQEKQRMKAERRLQRKQDKLNPSAEGEGTEGIDGIEGFTGEAGEAGEALTQVPASSHAGDPDHAPGAPPNEPAASDIKHVAAKRNGVTGNNDGV